MRVITALALLVGLICLLSNGANAEVLNVSVLGIVKVAEGGVMHRFVRLVDEAPPQSKDFIPSQTTFVEIPIGEFMHKF